MNDAGELIDVAMRVREHAYAPYSHFKVGAAVRGRSGRIYAGCNVENVSFGLTSCAERNAVFAAVAAGERWIEAVAVAAASETPTPPCGACRQVLLEFGPGGEMPVILVTPDGRRRDTSLSALLPDGFAAFRVDA